MDLDNPAGETLRLFSSSDRSELLMEVRVRRDSRTLPGMEERSLILYTFSKKFAMTGWRLGAAIGPKPLIDVIAKLNVNTIIGEVLWAILPDKNKNDEEISAEDRDAIMDAVR